MNAVIAEMSDTNPDDETWLAKFTVMKENLEELMARGLGTRWPVILGGAALTRAYVEQDLAELFEGEVRYAKDAFEGLALMEPLVRVAHRASAASLASTRSRMASASVGSLIQACQ